MDIMLLGLFLVIMLGNWGGGESCEYVVWVNVWDLAG
jgi:hypothetical protein